MAARSRVAYAMDVVVEEAEHLLLRHRLDSGHPFEAGVVVGHERDPGVADVRLSGERRLGVLRHVDDVPPGAAVPGGLGTGREPRSLHDDDRAAVVHGDARAVSPRRRARLRASASYGSASETWCGPSSNESKNVSTRPEVRSTSWSTTTKSPGWMVGCSDPAANGASRSRTPRSRMTATLAR